MKSAALLVIASLLVMACVPKADLDETIRMLEEESSANMTLRARVTEVEYENANLRAQLAKQPDCSSP